MDRTGYQVSCVLPAHNEAESIARTVAGWAAALPRHTAAHEIIVVDDGSTDDTPRVLREIMPRFPQLRVITLAVNQGYGVAISSGFRQAVFPLLFFTDADGQYDPDDIRLLLERIRTAQLVVGYRTARADPGIRRPLSRGYNFAVRNIIGVGLRDINCAFKLMHRDTFRQLSIVSAGFSFNAELAGSIQRAGMRIMEVPVRHLPRLAGRSSVRPFHVVTSLYELARVRARWWASSGGAGPGPAIDSAAAGHTSVGLDQTAAR